MDLNGKIRNTLVSYLVTALSIFGFVASLKLMAQAKNPESKPMPRGVTCYLLGPVEIKVKTTDELDQQLHKLEELYQAKKIKKSLYDFRKKDLLKIKSDIENKNSDFMNNKIIERHKSSLKFLYKSFYDGQISGEEFKKRQKEVREKIFELTNDPSILNPSIEELLDYKKMIKGSYNEQGEYVLSSSNKYYQELQSQIEELQRKDINEAFSKEFELLELQRKNNEIDQQTYDLKNEILNQQKIYALRHSSMTNNNFTIRRLYEKRDAGELNEADFDKRFLNTIKRINERELQREQEQLPAITN